MGLIMEFDGTEGYEAVPLLPEGAARPGWGGAVLRRRSARPSRRAVLYVHALDDDFIAAEQVAWYTERGFHFYAADLRPVSEGRVAAEAGPRAGPPSPQPQAGMAQARAQAPPQAPSPPQGTAMPPGAIAPDSGGPGPAAPGSPAEDRGGAGPVVPEARPPGDDTVSGPAAWDTATFDAIRFDEAVREREPDTPATGSSGPGGPGVPAGPPGVPPGPPGVPSPPAVPGPRGAAARPAERSLPADVTRAAEELSECFASLDAAVAHIRREDGIGSVVLAAHEAGALVAALWAHARRGSQPADALILANPAIGDRSSWLARVRALREESAGRRGSPLLTGARRRVRRGLDIGCPVLVMSPAAGEPGGGGWLASRLRLGDRAPARLGAHVTWLSLEPGRPGEDSPAGLERRRYFEELTRWLGAYLSGQIRDQLL